MKLNLQLHTYAACTVRLMVAALFAGVAKSAVTQRTFATPEDAVNAVRDAVKSKDNKELHEIFGAKLDELMTGDAVEDNADMQEFATALVQRWTPVTVGPDSIVLNVGAENWPFPIPLVKHNGAWSFNTAAGKEEYINRN